MTAIVVPELRRHIKVRHGSDGTALERCEDGDCRVGADGIAECGRLACPACGSGGSNLSTVDLAFLPQGIALECECGYSWIPAAEPPVRAADQWRGLRGNREVPPARRRDGIGGMLP
jgi:hypothetical protein